jgi:hypothetical protein
MFKSDPHFNFPYALLPCHEGVKQNTIGVTRKTNGKLSHHRDHVPTYPTENEMSFIHHMERYDRDVIM